MIHTELRFSYDHLLTYLRIKMFLIFFCCLFICFVRIWQYFDYQNITESFL